MKLSEFVESVKYSELNTLAIKDDVPAITSFVNLGLAELYRRFSLSSEEHLIELQSGVTIYDLPEDFMYLTGAYEAPNEYSCENSVSLPVNEEDNPLSVNTINYHQVQIPTSITGSYIGLIYVNTPPKMSAEEPDTPLPLPYHLIQALSAFVAYKGHGGIRLDGQSEGDVYFIRFKQICDDLKRSGTAIASDDFNMDNRLALRGFP